MLNTLNLQKLLPISALCIAGLLLQGCGSKVDCNGNKVKENAVEIIQSHLNDAVWYKEMHAALTGKPELSSVKTLSRNDELKQSQCSAKYSFIYNGKQREVDAAYELAYLQDKNDVEVKVDVDGIKSALMGIVMREAPVRNGVEEIMDPKTGNLDHTVEWKNGIQDGVQKFYNPANNKLIAQVDVANNQKSGSEKRWNVDGSVLLTDLNWVNGKANGVEKQWDESENKISTELIWKDGKQTGFQRTYNYGSGVYEEFQYKDGMLDGKYKRYQRRDGTSDQSFSKTFLQEVKAYKNGKLDGLSQAFDEMGNLVSQNKYKEDHEEFLYGSQDEATAAIHAINAANAANKTNAAKFAEGANAALRPIPSSTNSTNPASLASPSAHATDLVGQCIFPQTKIAKSGRMEFVKPVVILSSPQAKQGEAMKLMSTFKIGAEEGGMVQLVSVPDYDKPDPGQYAGKVVGWAKLSDFVFQEPRNCN